MKIIKLTAEHFKRIEAVEISPEGNVIYITGKNGQGKTSILDAIWAGLQYPGKDELKNPIKDNHNKSEIKIDLGELYIERTFTKSDKPKLIVTTKDSTVPVNGPQGVLDKLIGNFTFDPTEFYRMKEKEQVDFLIDVMGLGAHLRELDHKREQFYNERTVVGRQLKEAIARSGQEPEKTEYISSEELTTKFREEKAKEEKIIEAKNNLANLLNEKQRLETEIQRLKQELTEVEKEQKAWQDYFNTLDEPAYENIQKQLSNVDANNAKARAWQDWQKNHEEVARFEKQSNGLTAQIQEIDKHKKALLDKAEFPIKLLTFDLENNNILYQNQPLKQASDAEQIRVSLALAMALNPELKIIRIRNGSLLDSTNKQIIKELADKNDYQVWVEQVSEDGKVGIYIEDGRIKAINGVPQK